MSMLRALRHRNYALFFTGQSVSLIGTWMQQMAVGWLIYRMTGSGLVLGIVAFLSQIPILLVTPFAGVIADRHDKKRLFFTTQTLAMAQAFALTWLVFKGGFLVWQLASFSFFLGVITAIDIPVRQSFVVDMLDDRKDLGNAIALNSIIFNGARFVGPTLAGIAIAGMGEVACFLLNALSYIAVLVALGAMRIKKNAAATVHKPFLEGLTDGFAYAFRLAPVRRTLSLLSITSLFGTPYLVVMPIFAKTVLRGDASTLGFLIGSSGVGALLGAIYMASRKDSRGLGKIMVRSSILLAAGLIGFGFSRLFMLSSLFMVIVGFGLIGQAVSSNTLLQVMVSDDKRGRVMSLFALSFMGMMPFGSLLSGYLTSKIGAPAALVMNGAVLLVAAIAYLGRIDFRPSAEGA